MSKKSRFRGPFEKQHRKRAEPLFKSVWQHLYHIDWLLPSQLNWKKSLSLTCKILGLLFNTLAADEKNPVLHRDNLTIPVQMQLSQKENTFSQFLSEFFKSSFNFQHFEKKVTFIAFLFRNLRTPKTKFDKCLKSLVSEDPSTSNMADV